MSPLGDRDGVRSSSVSSSSSLGSSKFMLPDRPVRHSEHQVRSYQRASKTFGPFEAKVSPCGFGFAASFRFQTFLMKRLRNIRNYQSSFEGKSLENLPRVPSDASAAHTESRAAAPGSRDPPSHHPPSERSPQRRVAVLRRAAITSRFMNSINFPNVLLAVGCLEKWL